jgi:hypothetical protein
MQSVFSEPEKKKKRKSKQKHSGTKRAKKGSKKQGKRKKKSRRDDDDEEEEEEEDEVEEEEEEEEDHAFSSGFSRDNSGFPPQIGTFVLFDYPQKAATRSWQVGAVRAVNIQDRAISVDSYGTSDDNIITGAYSKARLDPKDKKWTLGAQKADVLHDIDWDEEVFSYDFALTSNGKLPVDVQAFVAQRTKEEDQMEADD